MALRDRSRFTAHLTNMLHSYGFKKDEIADIILYCYTIESLRVLDLKIKALDLPPTTDTLDFTERKK